MRCATFVLVVMACLGSGVPMAFADPAEDDVRHVAPVDAITVLDIDGPSGLLANEGVAWGDVIGFEYSSPSYGSLTKVGSKLEYSPHDTEDVTSGELTFWTHGTDSFTYTTTVAASGFGNPTVSTATVFLIANHHGSLHQRWDFESGVPPGPSANGFTLAVYPEAALSGDAGLRAVLPVAPVSGSLAGWDVALQCPSGDGSHDSGVGCAAVSRDPFEERPIIDGTEGRFEVLGWGSDPSNGASIVRLVLRKNSEQVEVGGEVVDATGTVLATPWTPVTFPVHLELSWWARSRTSGPGGLLLRSNDLLVGTLETTYLTPIRDQSALVVDTQSGSGGALALDDIGLSAGCDLGQFAAWEPIRLDGFEHGLGGWSNAPTTSAVLSAFAAANGGFGLLSAPADTNEPYVLDTVPATEPHYRARFRVNTSSLTLGDGEAVTILDLSETDVPSPSNTHASLELVGDKNAVKLKATQVQSNGAGKVESALYPVGRGSHVIELAWGADSNTGSDNPNGFLYLWIDGERAATMVGLETRGLEVESVRLGATSASAGATGNLSFDDFESWRPAPPPGS